MLRQPSRWCVTASSVPQDLISLDGRSAQSNAWRGGAAYVQMCLTCGLEPGRPGHLSNCMCMCGLGKRGRGCGGILHGHGDAEGKCKGCGGGRPEIVSIGTTEVKVKRSRESYVPHVLRPGPSPVAIAAAVAAAVSVTVTHDAAAAVSATHDAAAAVSATHDAAAAVSATHDAAAVARH
jgi:hypothetical protein